MWKLGGWRRKDPHALQVAAAAESPAAAEAAFREIFTTYHPRLLAFFRKRVFTLEEAEDLTQDALLRVYQGRGCFEAAEDFESWLFTLATNVYRNWLRGRMAAKRKGQAGELAEVERRPERVVPGAPVLLPEQPLARFLDDETVRLVGQALQRLPAQMRRAALLRYHGGLQYQEIAEAMGVSIQTVKTHLFQARRRLKGELAPHLAPPEADEEELP